jgi:RNA polymerase sigma-70 factor (ECF subfamily)
VNGEDDVQTTSAQQIVRRSGVDNPADFPVEYWELIECYRSKLVAQALSILGNHADAEDAVQETFSQAFKQREKLSNAESVGAWLMAVNRDNALMRLRSRKRASGRLGRKQKDLPDRSVTTGGFSGIELRDLLTRIIATLPPEARAVTVLRFVENRSHKEIAEQLNVPLGTVASLVCNATQLLYERMKSRVDMGDGSSDSGAQR